MKIRSGFVSNSSSSSYVIVIEKSVFDNLLTQLSELQRDILAFLSGREGNENSQTFMGQKVVTIQYTEGNYSTLEDYAPGMGETGYKGILEKRFQEAQAKALAQNEDASYEDVQRILGKVKDEDPDPFEEWESIEEKIDALPKDKVLRFEQDF
jgi:hypothetical protein